MWHGIQDRLQAEKPASCCVFTARGEGGEPELAACLAILRRAAWNLYLPGGLKDLLFSRPLLCYKAWMCLPRRSASRGSAA